MVYHGIPWYIMVYHGSMVYNGIPYHGIPWSATSASISLMCASLLCASSRVWFSACERCEACTFPRCGLELLSPNSILSSSQLLLWSAALQAPPYFGDPFLCVCVFVFSCLWREATSGPHWAAANWPCPLGRAHRAWGAQFVWGGIIAYRPVAPKYATAWEKTHQPAHKIT